MAKNKQTTAWKGTYISYIDPNGISAEELEKEIAKSLHSADNPGPHIIVDCDGKPHAGMTAYPVDGIFRICISCEEKLAKADASIKKMVQGYDTAVRSALGLTSKTGSSTKKNWKSIKSIVGNIVMPEQGKKSDAVTRNLSASRDTRSEPATATFQLPPPFEGSPEQLARLRPHIINLERGHLSDSGIATTSHQDLKDIVESITAHCVKHGAKNKTLMFYAHGGLVDERTGLAMAWAYHDWSMQNDIYPVYFTWETGGLDAFWHVIAGERAAPGARGVTDWTDRIIERIASGIGRHVWGDMKDNAKRASADDGGATKFAGLLGKMINEENKAAALRVVAIGHSAGSIFHGHFLQRLSQVKSKMKIDQLHLLAPAIRETDFEELLGSLIGKSKFIGETSLFAMTRAAERDDNCGGVYRKSLLYLVRNAFEEGDDVRIAGLQESWNDSDLFQAKLGDAIWSPTLTDSSLTRNHSLSTSHGGFDNDPATMESVLRRIKGIEDGKPLDIRFPEGTPRAAVMQESPPNYYGIPASLAGAAAGPTIATHSPSPATSPQQIASLGAQRMALCIGNNAFRGQPVLSGCINDAQKWSEVLATHGFQSVVAPDCTAEAMRSEIRRLVSRASPGDSIVIQISSHGTQIRDVDGDELNDDEFSDVYDEAVIGVDADQGGLIVDDEWASLLKVPQGVHLVRFHDFCSSGRSSRMAMEPGAKVRFVPLSSVQEQRALARAGKRPARGNSARGTYGEDLTNLTFCACLPDKQAFEMNGMGAFSRAATAILGGGRRDLTANQLFEAISAEMTGGQQKPLIEGPERLKSAPVFGV